MAKKFKAYIERPKPKKRPRVHKKNKNKQEKRNRLLAETDYYALSDVTMSDEMKKYRQDLRDLPAGKDTVEKCDNATWPTKP